MLTLAVVVISMGNRLGNRSSIKYQIAFVVTFLTKTTFPEKIYQQTVNEPLILKLVNIVS